MQGMVPIGSGKADQIQDMGEEAEKISLPIFHGHSS